PDFDSDPIIVGSFSPRSRFSSACRSGPRGASQAWRSPWPRLRPGRGSWFAPTSGGRRGGGPGGFCRARRVRRAIPDVTIHGLGTPEGGPGRALARSTPYGIMAPSSTVTIPLLHLSAACRFVPCPCDRFHRRRFPGALGPHVGAYT